MNKTTGIICTEKVVAMQEHSKPVSAINPMDNQLTGAGAFLAMPIIMAAGNDGGLFYYKQAVNNI
ncbi:MAG: hypothetical protein QM726_12400 [Chitinophagaceae bacterium]